MYSGTHCTMCRDELSRFSTRSFEEQTRCILHSLTRGTLPLFSASGMDLNEDPTVANICRLVVRFRKEYRNQLDLMLRIFDDIPRINDDGYENSVYRSLLDKTVKSVTLSLDREAVSWGRVIAALAFFSEVYSRNASSPDSAHGADSLDEELVIPFGKAIESCCGKWVQKNGGWENIPDIIHNISDVTDLTPINKFAKSSHMMRVMGCAALGMGICTLLGFVATR